MSSFVRSLMSVGVGSAMPSALMWPDRGGGKSGRLITSLRSAVTPVLEMEGTAGALGTIDCTASVLMLSKIGRAHV